MAKLIIDFEGLICHVGHGDVKTHAVIVHEPTAHKPLIRADNKVYALQRWSKVSFRVPASGGAITFKTDFDARVPHLSRVISNGGIHSDVLNQKQALQAIVAYVVYPAGELSAPQPHPQKLKITLENGTPVTQCIAKGVRFESEEEVDGGVVMVVTRYNAQGTIIHTQDYAITDPYIQVNNVSAQGNHFHEFIRLTTANVIADVEQDEDCPEYQGEGETPMFTAKMDREQQAFRNLEIVDPSLRQRLETASVLTASINPECTNSQWP